MRAIYKVTSLKEAYLHLRAGNAIMLDSKYLPEPEALHDRHGNVIGTWPFTAFKEPKLDIRITHNGRELAAGMMILVLLPSACCTCGADKGTAWKVANILHIEELEDGGHRIVTDVGSVEGTDFYGKVRFA